MAQADDFIKRWQASGGSEQANSQLFLAELCDVLDLPRPDPAKPVNEENLYSFERKVYLPNGDGTERLQRLDLYRKGCFVLESKQGQEAASKPVAGLTKSAAVQRGSRAWEDTMQRAKRQAENYIRCLPAAEGRPPFLIVVDVGYCFDLYAEFSRSGGNYLHFRDIASFRIKLEDLARPEVRDLFRAIWNDPDSLDPARRAARVTEGVAAHLAELARLLEKDYPLPGHVSHFLMRCLFSMFAEDVGLTPAGSFTGILKRSLTSPELFEPLLRDLWTAMNDGTVSVGLGKKLLRFNGGLFANPETLPLGPKHLGILLEAARTDWQDVEPAIFGTLLERALDPRERHKLGAHYTPRAYVERLVLPTIMQPLRQEWDAVQAAASLLHSQGKEKEAAQTVADFHSRLLKIRVLDPACGSGNFLYVSMEHLKRLEGEVLQALDSYGGRRTLLQIDPHQFLGLEVNPRAAHIAEMVLWIGALQWHFRTNGRVNPPEPVIRSFGNVQCRDALLVWQDIRPATNADGEPLTRWDGLTYKEDPVTGRQIPDENARVTEVIYEGAAKAEWPEADFIVGNPPFVGNKRMRELLGSSYADTLRTVYDELPESCDFVMYWWHKAAELARAGKIRRFGFITTNSLMQIYNRKVTARHLQAEKHPICLCFAIPNHPWVDAADGAAVRIAMTVAKQGDDPGELALVTAEYDKDGDRERGVTLTRSQGCIHANLTIGANVTQAKALQANDSLCSRGVQLHGSGFIVTPKEAKTLGYGTIPGLERHIRHYRNGKDLAGRCRNVMVIDLFGLSSNEVLTRFPAVYQWVRDRVKPERDVKASRSKDYAAYAKKWWLFGKPRETLRPALSGLEQYIATPYVAKHRFFVFLEKEILPDDGLVVIASDDAFHLGVLSSRIHVCWTLAAGGRLGVCNGPRYNHSVCFFPFPFPAATEEQKEKIRNLGEQLDAHRKARQKEHPKLTLTGMYNVLEALREDRSLTPKEKSIHEAGLVSILLEIHDQLDAAVAEAYGWPKDLPDEEILARLTALNAERQAEEKAGTIRWLRPDYQAKGSVTQAGLDLDTGESPAKTDAPKSAAKRPWPADLPAQMQAVRDAVQSLHEVPTPENVAKLFKRAPIKRLESILESLELLGFI